MSSSRTGYQHRLRFWLALALGSLCAVQLVAAMGRSPAQAQEATLTTDEDIANYANVVVAIEPLRKAAYEEASDVLAAANSEVSLVDNRLSCLTSEVENMPDVAAEDQVSLQRILVSYCNTASELADENGLTPQRFNSITAKHREDRELAQKVRAAIADSKPVSIETVE
ncbi:MAG: hypothetical protein DCF25_01090 [Leptolyngbya foveolarum]|uniref:DUF4168 domain-containing protein n=1 Tax=Leptolyngbya foveolarum TaxID=47253 RepID=A0A2W4UUZ1_9CYAN|nr:MAG: hypothetical protein DCF25_01090 [Leptolyngbya foveolarum]